jgi:phosphoinositide-3-kinase regulatory subunit 4
MSNLPPQPAPFGFFYDTSASRACYLAPERFADAGAGGALPRVEPASDVFAAGAVLGALFADCAPLFDLAALMAWRAADADPRQAALAAIAVAPGLGAPAAALVDSMTARLPSDRRAAADYLTAWEGLLWRPYFHELHAAAAGALAAPSGDARCEMLCAALPALCNAVIDADAAPATAPAVAAARMSASGRGSRAVAAAAAAVVSARAEAPPAGGSLLVALATAALAGAGRRSTKARALWVLMRCAAPLATPAERTARVLPHVLAAAADRDAALRRAAVAAVARLCASPAACGGTPPLAAFGNIAHYALPALSRAPADVDEAVAAAASAALPRLVAAAAEAAERAAAADARVPYGALCLSLRAALRDSLADLLAADGGGAGAGAAATVAAFAASVTAGPAFLLSAGGAEALLPAALACLNRRRWRARAAAYTAAPALAGALGAPAVRAMASLAESGLADAHTPVAVAAARALAQLLAVLPGADGEARASAQMAAHAAAPLLVHRSRALRRAAAAALAAAADCTGAPHSAAVLAAAAAAALGAERRAMRAALSPGGHAALPVVGLPPASLPFEPAVPPSPPSALYEAPSRGAAPADSARAVGAAQSPAHAGQPQPSAPRDRALPDAIAAAASAALPGASLERVGGVVLGDSVSTPPARSCPAGVLVARLAEHRRRVNCLAAAPSGCGAAWALSCSDDGSARVWAAPSLAGDHGGADLRAALVYASQGGRLLAAAALSGDAAATGSSDGSVHAFRLDRGGGAALAAVADVRRAATPHGGAVTALAAVPRSALLLVGSANGVACWDMRAPGGDAAAAWRLPWPSAAGAPTALVVDPAGGHWVAAGARRGGVTLWDARFAAPLAAWRHPHRDGGIVDALAPAGTTPSGSPRLWAAVGGGEVALLDAGAGMVMQLLRLGAADGDTRAPAALDGDAGGARPGVRVRALAPAGPGAVLLGADDGGVRQWRARDAGASACTVVCSQRSSMPHEGPAVAAAWRGVPVLEQRLGTPAATPAGAAGGSDLDVHPDAITALALFAADGAPPLLLSAGRDGAVNVWR